MMRMLLSVIVVAGAVLVGYLLAPKAAAQGAIINAMGLTEGETVRLVVDMDRGITHPCVVSGLRSDFLGCKVEGPGLGPATTRWYNLRLISRVDQNVGR